jgi:hypothetical protein
VANAEALSCLALLIERERPAEAVELYRRAIATGDVGALNKLAALLAWQIGPPPQPPPEPRTPPRSPSPTAGTRTMRTDALAPSG